MRKSLIYFTSLILLTILPLSVIGVNLSTHLCKSNNTAFVNLSWNIIDLNKAEECCSIEEKSQNPDDDVSNCCQTKITLEQNCNSCNHNGEKDNGSGFIEIKCCFSQLKSFGLKDEFVLPNLFISLNDCISQFGLESLPSHCDLINVDLSYFKKVQFPIKELIFYIIEYIHNCTLSGGSTEEPYLF